MLKTGILLAAMITLPLAAQTAKNGKAAATKATAAKTVAKTVVDPKAPPKGAVEVRPGIWRYADANKKVWTYQHSPFGWMRNEGEPPADEAREAISVPSDITVEDKGDSLVFARPTPFGASRWTKKKTELDDLERAVWQRAQARNAQAAAQTAAQTAKD
jgi:hypothetical protein